MILKRVGEVIFFQSNKYTARKVRDGKEVSKYLMVFNLCDAFNPCVSKREVFKDLAKLEL